MDLFRTRFFSCFFHLIASPSLSLAIATVDAVLIWKIWPSIKSAIVLPSSFCFWTHSSHTFQSNPRLQIWPCGLHKAHEDPIGQSGHKASAGHQVPVGPTRFFNHATGHHVGCDTKTTGDHQEDATHLTGDAHAVRIRRSVEWAKRWPDWAQYTRREEVQF